MGARKANRTEKKPSYNLSKKRPPKINHLLKVVIINNQKRFQCTECRLVSARRYNAKRHVSRFHNKIFVKECCSVVFYTKGEYYKHLQNVHDITRYAKRQQDNNINKENDINELNSTQDSQIADKLKDCTGILNKRSNDDNDITTASSRIENCIMSMDDVSISDAQNTSGASQRKSEPHKKCSDYRAPKKYFFYKFKNGVSPSVIDDDDALHIYMGAVETTEELTGMLLAINF